MAYTFNITEKDPLFAGAARVLIFTVYTDATTDAQILAGVGIIQDVTGWTFRWRLNSRVTGNLVEKTSVGGISIIGTYNADPLLNTQKVYVSISATDIVLTLDQKCDHALWRTNAGNETPLTDGFAVVKVVP